MVRTDWLAHRLQPPATGAPYSELSAAQTGVLGVGARPSGEVTVATEDRGFASMERNRQREIASKGGKAAHQKGTAHEWTSEEARAAGRKGGMASHRRKEEPEVEGDFAPVESDKEQILSCEEIR